MAGRRLDAEEQALWRRVAASVRPLRGHKHRAGAPQSPPPADERTPPLPIARPAPPPAARPIRTAAPGDTLDAGWDRRLRRGMVAPDRTIDLHGHTLASAHGALDQALDRAVADGARLLLLVTGRPPRPQEHGGGERPRRGAIRASIGDWLAGSRHSGRIAAVRNAHPRHGGAGALYVILRRPRNIHPTLP